MCPRFAVGLRVCELPIPWHCSGRAVYPRRRIVLQTAPTWTPERRRAAPGRCRVAGVLDPRSRVPHSYRNSYLVEGGSPFRSPLKGSCLIAPLLPARYRSWGDHRTVPASNSSGDGRGAAAQQPSVSISRSKVRLSLHRRTYHSICISRSWPQIGELSLIIDKPAPIGEDHTLRVICQGQRTVTPSG